MRVDAKPRTTARMARPHHRWVGGRTCRRSRNYVFIVITLTLVAMQVYLYMSTPGLGIEARGDDEGLMPGGATNDLPGRRLAAEDPSGNRSNSNEGQILNKRIPGLAKHRAPGDKSLAQNHSNLAASFSSPFKIYLPSNSSFQSPCGNLDPYTQSALERAQSIQCRQEIVQVACSYKRNELYPMQLSRSCPLGGPEYGEYQGCFGSNDEKKIILDQMTEFPDGNTPISCVDHCLRSGFEYAGVQTGFKCWCGVVISESAESISEDLCNISCPGNRSQLCGGHGPMSVYRTGFGAKPSESVSYVDLLDEEIQNLSKARIVFMLTVNGRAVRQVNRLLKVLYRPYHFYYIHVDARQNYLHRELSKLTGHLPNVRLSPSRFASIWGGASLLAMLLQCMKELLQREEWKWDYFINLSESDYPVKAVEELEAFLTKYPGRNFLKSHGKDTPRFIRKQGLNMLFHECDNHMWRLGSRSLQNKIRIDGGSDWVCLNRDFVQFLIYGNDQLLSGLKAFWKYSLLPAESFFHTVLQNSIYCTTAVNNNLHLTNWHRKQGCKCQYKHIVDWCGCSPNDFLPEDLPKIQALSGKPIYFSRKFEAVINQEIMNSVDSLIGIKYLPGTPALNSFWLNEFHYLDKRHANDISYSYYLSFARITLAKLQFNNKLCSFAISRILESTVFNHNDAFQGVIVTFEVTNRASNVTETIETFLNPIPLFQKFKVAESISRLKSVQIGTNYDPKEEIFRNYGHFLGPESELIIELRWGPGEAMVVTAAFIDPSGTLAVSYDVSINVGTLTHNYKMELNRPLRPGLWKLKILHAWQLLAEFQFVILPYSHVGAEYIGAETARQMHSGPDDGSYVDQDFSNIENLLNIGDSKQLKSEAEENAKRHGPLLLSWIDDLVVKTWHVRDTCLADAEPDVLKFNQCLPTSKCNLVSWSTRFPDIKSDLSDLNHRVGVLR